MQCLWEIRSPARTGKLSSSPSKSGHGLPSSFCNHVDEIKRSRDFSALKILNVLSISVSSEQASRIQARALPRLKTVAVSLLSFRLASQQPSQHFWQMYFLQAARLLHRRILQLQLLQAMRLLRLLLWHRQRPSPLCPILCRLCCSVYK